MKNTGKNTRRVSVHPTTPREPLFIRLCHLFLDNLTNLLRAGLVIGSIVLVQDLQVLLNEVRTPVTDAGPSTDDPAVVRESDDLILPAPVLTEGVMQALNCTYDAYRKSHFDECVKDDSGIYKRPQADPNDTGFVIFESPVLYAANGLTPDRD